MKNSLLLYVVIGFFMLGCSEKKEQKEVTFTSKNISKKESVKPSPQEAIDTVKSIANLSWHSHVETAFELAKKSIEMSSLWLVKITVDGVVK